MKKNFKKRERVNLIIFFSNLSSMLECLSAKGTFITS